MASSARWTLLLLAVAALFGALWWTLDGGAGAPDVPASVSLEPGSPGRTSPEPANPIAPSVPRVEGEAAEGAGPLTRVEAGVPERREREEIEVRVVRSEGGQPFPGARVTFLDLERSGAGLEAWEDAAQRAAFLEGAGASLTADVQGRLSVPATGRGALFLRHPGWYGELSWEGPVEAPLVLAASRSLGLRVRVIDGRGRPVPNVLLAIVRHAEGVDTPVLTRRTASPLGVATFQHLPRILSGSQEGSTHAVTLAFPCADAPRLGLDLSALPQDVVDLELPPVGSLLVRVVDENARALDEVVDVTLGSMVMSRGAAVFQQGITQRLVQGETRFEYVGVGARAALRLDGSRDRPSHTEEVDGPGRPGSEAQVTLVWDDRYPVVTGRAVLENGAPLPNQRGRFVLDSGGRGAGGPPLTTDAAGRFRVVVREPWERGTRRTLELTLFALRGEAPRVASLDLSQALPPGETDLGAVVYRPLPTLVSGTIKDATGQPVFGAHVRAELRAGEGWLARSELSATSDREGRFAIFGEAAGQDLRLRYQRRGFRDGSVPGVRPGTNGVELILQPVDPDEDDDRP